MMAYKKNDTADAMDDVATDPEEEGFDDGIEPLVPEEDDFLKEEGDVSGFGDEEEV